MATTVRLSQSQKRRLAQATRELERLRGRKLTQGEVVELLARVAAAKPELFEEVPDAQDLDLQGDRLFDPTFSFDLGKTDAKALDRILYGGR